MSIQLVLLACLSVLVAAAHSKSAFDLREDLDTCIERPQLEIENLKCDAEFKAASDKVKKVHPGGRTRQLEIIACSLIDQMQNCMIRKVDTLCEPWVRPMGHLIIRAQMTYSKMKLKLNCPSVFSKLNPFKHIFGKRSLAMLKKR